MANHSNEKADHLNESEVVQNLEAAGCSADEIQYFLKLAKAGKETDCKRLLDVHRKDLLDNLHSFQTKIDNLDYLKYQMRSVL